MEYTLNINSTGKLEGWQEISYTLAEGRFRLMESQYFQNGDFVMSTILVYDRKTAEEYTFRSSDWGTPELARDAAEMATGGWSGFVIVNEGFCSIVCKPMNEGAFV